MPNRLNRRRFLAITAACAAFPGWAARAEIPPLKLYRWQGVALGAEASIALYHHDQAEARALFADSMAEIERLERVFSLYRPDSALSALNRDGRLDAPPLDLVRLLWEARHYSEISAGAFDVTVQPLWRLYQSHFATEGADPAGPPAAGIVTARALVDWRGISLEGGRITLARPGMAVTLNGIAQGYITDRVADLLRSRGMERVLLDLGEARALGPHADGRPWSIGIANPRAPKEVLRTLAVTTQAVSGSGGYGMAFDRAGRFTHLFDPATGHP
ncbi:MAG: FAD:protein FMN transferase, partial [Rhodospirillales bacterium]|nr:FAD:protein FMN transferase [Rhodospirillales bacterium]